MRTSATEGYDQGWSNCVGVRFPTLGGEQDLLIEPRAGANKLKTIEAGAARKAIERVETFSSTAAGFARTMQLESSALAGCPDFDAAYRIAGPPAASGGSLIDPDIARRFLNWPPHAIQPHSLLVWRDPYGLHVQARLPAPPNWAALHHLIDLATDIARRLPRGRPERGKAGVIDRLIDWLSDA